MTDSNLSIDDFRNYKNEKIIEAMETLETTNEYTRLRALKERCKCTGMWLDCINLEKEFLRQFHIIIRNEQYDLIPTAYSNIIQQMNEENKLEKVIRLCKIEKQLERIHKSFDEDLQRVRYHLERIDYFTGNIPVNEERFDRNDQH